ncbi:transposase family protein [Shewanella sp. S1-49-MNA-CIBAN-0167]|uniref:integrase catalytic domain-containing protein n=1 Tax=Shewanella sp. S1-49-MNA-CIBAN-0167 TaxID=3140468 RepID=UPI003322CEEE
MIKSMSLNARKELLASIKQKYHDANWIDKGKILDGIVAATGYERKYTIELLNTINQNIFPKNRKTPHRYDEQLRQALLAVWYAANQICSKRLVPFLPYLVEAMERHGHLRLPIDVREKLLQISPSTVDRILKPEREKIKQSVSTTRKGNLLKHQIQVRTFADWDDVIPGFLEADLVAHCGGNTNGSFLNTLTLVDIATGWLECMPLLRKSASDVIDGLQVASDLLPFPMQGVDTDCGSEFINYELLEYCEENNITFTRARTHRKNDQAHVEEKNGSVVRRLVGYDRYEGWKAWEALARLYRIVMMYVNFYQPSLKLLEKERVGAKVSKKYDDAKTPYQRVLLSDHVNQSTKESLRLEYERLDPVYLLAQLESLQDELWKYSWDKRGHAQDDYIVTDDVVKKQLSKIPPVIITDRVNRHYHRNDKVDFRKSPRTWLTRKDPFEDVWDEIRLRMELAPENNARKIILWLMDKYPDKFLIGQTRTLQRRLALWRQNQASQEEKLRDLMINELVPVLNFNIPEESEINQ